MGHAHPTTKRGGSTRGRRLGWRKCLRKGCGQKFQARRRKDRYCREPDCQRELDRWRAAKRRRLAAKRQRKCRAKPEGREKHATAQRKRRAEARRQSKSAVAASQPCAWSRRTRLPEIFCDRPGCYEVPRDGPHVRYCGHACASAMRQAQDRERKCLRRKAEASRIKRGGEYQEARVKRREGRAATAPSHSPLIQADRRQGAVLLLKPGADSAVDLRGPREVKNHDPKTSLDPRPRAPPAP
jgi:hypothetical protein